MKKLLLPALLLASPLTQAASTQKPNIVVILADDLGYGDVQCNNPERGKIPTPHIDRLAAGGMRFTDGHSSSGVCSPSRYTLLTGRYHWRSRLQGGIVNRFGEPLITPERFTIANLAKSHGYRTAAIGKWHLGWNWPIPSEQRPLLQATEKKSATEDDESAPPATPSQRDAWKTIFAQTIPGGPTANGFDSYFGTDVPNWPPYCFIENDRTVGIPSEFLPNKLFKNHLASTQGPALPDWKLEKILPTLADRATQFVSEAAKSDAPYLLYLPRPAPHTPLAVNPEWQGKSGLSPYADFVMETDAVVGRVLDAIEKTGESENTLVVLTSDNGCASYIGVADLERMGHYPSGPLRGYKTSAWEGGHRVPFLVRWPAVVKPGSVCTQLVLQADLMATFAEVLGSKLAENAGVDSFSLLPLLNGGNQPVRQNAVNCSAQGVPAVREGSWKLILAQGSGDKGKNDPAQPVQLYNLAEDLGETKNLAAEQPERVAQMKALLEKLITDGRSTPGAPQTNDVEVKRYPQPESKAKTR
jgi:arylsulfatase A-like enzyme